MLIRTQWESLLEPSTDEVDASTRSPLPVLCSVHRSSVSRCLHDDRQHYSREYSGPLHRPSQVPFLQPESSTNHHSSLADLSSCLVQRSTGIQSSASPPKDSDHHLLTCARQMCSPNCHSNVWPTRVSDHQSSPDSALFEGKTVPNSCCDPNTRKWSRHIWY